MAESVEIRVTSGGLSKSSKINLSIIKQPKISILFLSYLRIGWINFDATSSDLVAPSLLCRMVQSASCFIERKSKKLRIKENEIWWQNLAKYGWHLEASQKVEVSLFPSKNWSFSSQKMIVSKKLISIPQKVDRSPSKGHPPPSILMPANSIRVHYLQM
jgi:hypothetical protein